MKEESLDEPPFVKPLICSPQLLLQAMQAMRLLAQQLTDQQAQQHLISLSNQIEEAYNLFMLVHEPEPDCECLPENAKDFQIQAHA